MKIKKTVGNPKLDMYVKGKYRKSYVIHTTCGEKFYAKAVGSQGYECGGVNFDTLRSVKSHIEAGGFGEDAEEPTETSTADGLDIWDCVHPCALLIALQNTIMQGCHEKQVLKTLDNYGWLDCIGRPDVARAEREIKRVQNLTGAQSDDN